jgi:hypothetical protein
MDCQELELIRFSCDGTDSGGVLVLDSAAAFRTRKSITGDVPMYPAHSVCRPQRHTECAGYIFLNRGGPSPSARQAEAVRPATGSKRDPEGNIVPACKRRGRNRRPAEGVDDSPGAAQ